MLTKQDIFQKIRDDLHLTGKQKIMDDLPENQNALFIGKFRVPTKAHMGVIAEALTKFPHVVVCVVQAVKDKKEGIPYTLQQELFNDVFGDQVSIITHSSGNITSIIDKSPKRIRYVLAGSDRVDAYKGQLERHPNVSVIETVRDMDSDDNVSATKTIDAIKNNDISVFKSMTDPAIWGRFDEIRKYFKE